ncbi:TELO2-interacting protein 1 homolog [Daphnia carinata]|uniref:TELO2-interacting protein 1 homolog n=1 Tax=Daphnia carinata TaxID=120202 RepID=UPI00257FC915|nr:TELO2-interacting protein 1 homolog [Daphnia carinata]
MGDFSKFKPICVELLKTPSLEKLAKLKLLVIETETESIKQLQEYVLFPLFIIISNEELRNEKTFCAACNCVQEVCRKSTLNVYKIFSDFLLQFLLVVHCVNPTESTILWSEEVKLASIESLLALLRSASSDVILELLSETNRPQLGHLVFTLLKVAANEELKELRLSALNTLMELSCIPTTVIGSSLAGFFPGTCTHMLKIINGSIKQSHILTKRAVEVFSSWIRIILNNSRFENAGKSGTEWLQQTRTNLHLLFEKIMKNPDMHWKVKIGITSLVSEVLEECSVTLEPSLPLLIKKLVQLTADECLEVQEAAKERITVLSHSQTNFDAAVRQNLYDIVTCLPRIVTQGITHDQLVVLQELQGHLTLLGPRLEQSLIFSGLRQRLFKGLLISATLEPTKVIESDEPFNLQYLRENRVVSLFAACSLTIGRYGNLADTSDYLLDVVRQKDSFDKESVYVMNLVLKGAKLDPTAFTTVIKEYSTCLTHLTTESKTDIIVGHLMLLVIGELAVRMGKDFSPLLITALKPCLEKAGNPEFCEVGIRSLQRMAEALQLSTVSQLLEENADYYAPQLSYQLQNIVRYPRAIDLLRALLMLSDIRMDYWLERMVQHALKGLDKNHSLRALPYVQVFELYAKAALKAKPAGPDCAKPLSKGEAISVEEVARRIADYKANIKLTETFSEANDEDDAEEAEEIMEAEVEQVTDVISPPPQVNIVADILDRCTKILPQCEEEQLYAALMKTICLSVEVLSSHEDVFLPKVHKLWEPLKNQLLGTSHLKQKQALEVFLSLVRCCPDFIRHRAVREVVPKLVTFLQNQANASRGRSSRAHIASQAYKLQKSALSAMGTIVEFLDPPVLEVVRIVQAISLYLSNKQVSELQNLAKENLIAIAKYHSGSVWLILHSMIAKRTFVRPGFCPIEVGTVDENSEFKSNAEELAKQLYPLIWT